MNYKALFFTSILLLAGCGTQYTHCDLPNNRISFSADGGVVEYMYPYGLVLGSIFIDGERQQVSPLYDDSKIVGECSGWISFIDGWRVGAIGNYSIEVSANPQNTSRSAILNFDMGKQYGEIYIYQDGRQD